MTGDSFIEANEIHKSHDGEPTLKGVGLNVNQGEILCLLGPSGCGKTTLLRIIAGLEKPDRGDILRFGKSILNVAPHRKRFSMMFQEFALFPHKNVFENVAFGLQMLKLEKTEVEQRAQEMIELVGLNGFEKRDVSELSGGERQRVALARSLAPAPDLLMLDEPMGSLDRALRERLVNDLRTILKKVKATVIFVTHDQNEAFVLADRIAVFNRGFIEQIDTPFQLYRNPANRFVAEFLGFQNFVPVNSAKESEVITEIGAFPFKEEADYQSKAEFILVRPEAAVWVSDQNEPENVGQVLSGELTDIKFQGSVYQVTVQLKEKLTLILQFPSEREVPKVGEEMKFRINQSAVSLI